MREIPNSVKEYVSNARYYLEAADKLPPPTKNAAHILLLLIGWENIVIADEELSAWARKTDVDERIYKSHAAKLRSVPHDVTRIILGPSGTKPREVKFASGRALEELRMACQYGSDTETKEVRELFSSGWHIDNLCNGLIQKIGWVEMMIGIYEELNQNRSNA